MTKSSFESIEKRSIATEIQGEVTSIRSLQTGKQGTSSFLEWSAGLNKLFILPILETSYLIEEVEEMTFVEPGTSEKMALISNTIIALKTMKAVSKTLKPLFDRYH